MALEGGERDAALVRLVAVLDQEAGHATRLAAAPHPDIGRAPRSRTLISLAGLCSPESPRDMARVADHLVGRAAELAAIDRALDGCATGRRRRC